MSIEYEQAYGNNVLPGQIYSADDQCQLMFGYLSHYCNGVIKNFFNSFMFISILKLLLFYLQTDLLNWK